MKTTLKKSQKALKTLSHPLASDIFEFVKENKDTPVNVIYKALKIEQSVCSSMLRTLRESNLVTDVKISREIRYRVNTEEVRTLFNSLRREICGR